MEKKNGFKETEIGKIPKGWKIRLLSEVVEINPKRKLKKGVKSKWVSMADLENFNKKIQNYSSRAFIGGSKFQNGDTIMARITPCLENGKIAFVDILEDGEIGTGSTEFIVLCKKEGLTENNFVYYLSTSSKIKAHAIASMTGTSGRQRVQTDLLSIKQVLLPSPSEQKAIAKILSDLDEKIEVNRKMNEILEELGQTLFKRWFVDFEFPNEKGKPYRSSGGRVVESELGEIPEGWKVSEIGGELETMLGGTPARAKKGFWTGGTIGWINSGAINDFPIIKPSDMITEEAVKKSATKLMPIKTVVLPFVISLDKEIKISILGFSTCGNQSVIGIIENKKIPAEYIYYWVNYMKKDIYSWATGGAQQHINQKVVVDTPILIPDDQTMNKYKTILRSVFDKIIKNAHEILSLEQIRDSLLPKLMTGKVRVKK